MVDKKRYGYCESSAIKATTAGHIFSVVDKEDILENGMVVALGDMVENDEIHAISTPTAEDKVVLILDPAIIYDAATTAGNAEVYYYIKKGVPARAYEIVERDRYAISVEMITALDGEKGPQAGNYLVASGRKYAEVADKPTDAAFVAKILKIEYKSNLTIARLEVIKNA